jgi:hypothetical protein
MEQVIIALLMVSICGPRLGLPATNWRVTENHGNRHLILAFAGNELQTRLNIPCYVPASQTGHIKAGQTAGENSSPAEPEMMAVMRDIFRKEGVPQNLAWLAKVESSFDPEAVSSAGAVGLFQLMPATAERFGLQIYPVDDRKTPGKSAKAAACYLRQLHSEFGEWSLALAAYNAGEGRVRRALKAQKARTYLEIMPHLPAETRNYVPRVMTLMALRDDQGRGVSSAIVMP